FTQGFCKGFFNMSISAYRTQIFNDHNQYRARHQAQPLRLVESLNSSAQAYAQQLAYNDAGIPHSDYAGKYGENLYYCTGMSPLNASHQWYNEESMYDYNVGDFDWTTGHFTQMVWRETTSIGVGIAQSNSGRHFVVAHYVKPGNATGQFAQNVLPPSGNGAVVPTTDPSPNSNTMSSLSAAAAGQRSIRTHDNQYVRAWRGPSGDRDWYADKAGHCKECEHWYIEDHYGKVVLKAYCSEGKFLRAHPNGAVDFADKPQGWEMWTPVKNGDGSWSFQSQHGTWLSAHRADGIVCTMPHNLRCEHFWLESW
ncbi:hypothetical protein PMAYCL1PPCAC_21442, partial [Pristionchus mayeri]